VVVLVCRAIGIFAVLAWRFLVYRPDLDNRDALADGEFDDRGDCEMSPSPPERGRLRVVAPPRAR
jgi:hypothetical protein